MSPRGRSHVRAWDTRSVHAFERDDACYVPWCEREYRKLGGTPAPSAVSASRRPSPRLGAPTAMAAPFIPIPTRGAGQAFSAARPGDVVLSACTRVVAGPKVPCTSRRAGTSCSATSRTTGSALGRDQRGPSASFAGRPRFANGNTLDAAGRGAACEHGSRSVAGAELDTLRGVGRITFSRASARHRTTPWSARDGALWFTNFHVRDRQRLPGASGKSKMGRCHILPPGSGRTRVTRSRTISKRPNGLAFARRAPPVRASARRRARLLRVFAVRRDGALSGGGVFATCARRGRSMGCAWTRPVASDPPGDGVRCLPIRTARCSARSSYPRRWRSVSGG